MADVFYIKQGDTLPSMEVILKDADAVAVDLSAADSVDFHMTPPNNGTVIDRPAVIVDAVTGSVRFDWQATDTAVAGIAETEFQVNWSDGSIETFPNNANQWVKITAQVG